MFDSARYKKEHEAIWREYRKKYQDRNSYLFEDGVIDPEKYCGILFLLKEAYSKEQTYGEWNLVEMLAENGPWKMWNRVSEWTCGIENTSERKVAPFRKISNAEKRKALSHIAVVNLKKVEGSSASNYDDLKRYVDENKNILQREIVSMHPGIIVCGNTFNHLKDIFDIVSDEKCDNWYYWLEIAGIGDVLVLDYYHPAVRYPPMLTYYGIVNIYQQALLNKPE